MIDIEPNQGNNSGSPAMDLTTEDEEEIARELLNVEVDEADNVEAEEPEIGDEDSEESVSSLDDALIYYLASDEL